MKGGKRINVQNEMERIGKEVVVACIEILFRS
jgi:hypothetical protein